MRKRLGRWARRFFTSFVALWIVIAFCFASANVKTCRSTQRSWDAIDRIVQAATHPPSRAGTVLTPEQKRAVAAYRELLVEANGERPSCSPF